MVEGEVEVMGVDVMVLFGRGRWGGSVRRRGARGMVVVVVVVVVDVMVLFETKGGRGGACVQDLQEG